jgi:sigma-B regulation protein RsbU (phosphoserine phosphatase)
MAWPGDQLLVAIGDVSGKGIPAALTTAQVTTEMNALTDQLAGNLHDWVRALNAVLCGRLAAGRFVATTFLLYNPQNSTMEVLCAGQYAPWRWDEETDSWHPLDVVSGPPIGLFASQKYESHLFPCGPGEKWLLFSDGITEGRNRKKEEYGNERLRASLKSSSPSRVLDAAWENWKNFVNTDALHDDACLALLSTRPEPVIDLPSKPESCKHCRNFVEAWSRLAGFSDIERGQIVLALDEAFTNIIKHTYKGEAHHLVQVRAEVNKETLVFRIRDYGPQLELGKLKGRALDDVKPGGLGLHLLKATFPDIKYTACEPGTELRLGKPLPRIAS